MAGVEWPDIVALIVYFVIVLGVGFWATCRVNTGTSQGYFLAGRSSHWIVIGASTFSTNVGAPMFIGLAGSAAATGIAVVMFEWHAMFTLVALGWIFLPVYRASGCTTMPEYLKLRFGGKRISLLLAVVHTVALIVSQISGQMYAGALFIKEIFKWDLYLSVGLILAVTAVYTVIGGLTAVMWTDSIQSVILVIGSMILGVISLNELGGFGRLREEYMRSAANYTLEDVARYGSASNYSCGMPLVNSFHIFRPADDGSYPWPGLIFGLTILATNAWCTDQICVQRSLSAKSVSHAKGGVLMAAYLKILPFLLFVIPGMASRVLYPNEVACADPELCMEICGNANGCSNIAYPLLVDKILPKGFRGVMFAALISALVSSLTSYFNSSSTIFTLDIYKRLKRRASETELMIVGRVYTIILVLVSIAWLPILEKVQGTMFWDYTQNIHSHMMPPFVMTFLIGLFWKRATEQGAFWSSIICVTVGLVRLALLWIRKGPMCGSGDPDLRWPILSSIHYMHFAIILAAMTSILMVSISLMTPPRDPKKLRRVTFYTRNDPQPQELSSESEDDYAPDAEQDQMVYTEPLSRCSKSYMKRYLCGVGENRRLTKAEHLASQKKLTDISEQPSMKMFLNGNAVLCLVVAVFIHGFWY